MLETLKVTRLSNGIQVMSVARPEAEGVQVAIYARVGSRNETEPLNGASHFIEHMLFKGTPARTARQISQAIEGQGGVLNAYTDRDATCYYARVPYDKADLALEVLGDFFYNASFDPRELDRERRVIAEEIRMYDDHPDSVAMDRLAAQLWSGHPLGRPIGGTEQNVLEMSRANLLAYRKANYAPCRTVFAFFGRVEHEACVAKVARLAGRLRNPKALREPEPFTRAIPLAPFSLTRRDIQQTQLAFGWRVPGFEDPKARTTCALLSGLLGESMMSRLFQSIRERRGLCYSVSSDLSSYVDCGALIVTAGCHPDKALGCARAILAEIRRLIERPVGAAELRRTRDYQCGRFRLRMDSSPASWAANRLLFGLDTDAEAVLEAVRAVTADELRVAAEAFLRPDALAMTVVAPSKAKHSAEEWASVMKY